MTKYWKNLVYFSVVFDVTFDVLGLLVTKF